MMKHGLKPNIEYTKKFLDESLKYKDFYFGGKFYYLGKSVAYYFNVITIPVLVNSFQYLHLFCF